MSMSDDDEPYDPDGDVSRFLHSASPEAHIFPFTEPEGTLVGLYQNAPAITDEVQVHQAPQSLNATSDLLGHQVPNTEFQGHPPAAHFVLPVPAIDAAEQYQAPIINAEQYQTSAMDDVEYYQPMAMDNIQPTQMLAPEMHHHGFGGFPDPTPMHCDGVDEAPSFQGNMHMLANGVIPDPSLSTYEQLIKDGEPELAEIIRDIENAAGAAGATLNDVHPVKEDVFFRPIMRGQLDCSRCYSVREVMCLDGRRKMHFMVHASEPGVIFQHAIVDRMSIGADGHFLTEVLLHHDLRWRNHEWVHNFIARTVEMMKRNPGQMQDTCSSNYAAVCTNVATAPPLSNHILSAPAATTAAQTVVTVQEQQTTDAPGIAEAAAPQAIVQAAVVSPQEQENTRDGAGVVETAAPEAAEPAVTAPQELGGNTDAPEDAEAAVPEAAKPGVTATQEQENTDAPPAEEATGPQAVQPAVSQTEENKDVGPVFAPFNWEGFQPEILESSHVKPYDPESGINVLLYPSLVEQIRQNELARKERKRLSKMPALDTTTYLEMSGDDFANEPKLGSLASFRRLCQRDPTYRIYSRRVNSINRKITKLQESVARVGTRGTRGLFAIKQKMETYKREKTELYDMINKAMEENERDSNNGGGPSNRAEPSNRAGPSNEAGASNDAASPSDTAAIIPSSDDGAGTSNDVAGPSNAVIPSSDGGAGISNDDAGPFNKSNTTIVVPSSSNCAGPSGSK